MTRDPSDPAPGPEEARSILDALGLAVVCLDHGQRLTHATPRAAELLGLVPEDLGRQLAGPAARAGLPDLGPELGACLERGQGADRVVSLAGRYLGLQVRPLAGGGQGGPAGAVVCFRDVTERHLLEEEFRALAENAPDIVFRWDRRLRHLYVNRQVEKATGRSREEFLGRTNRELGMPPELAARWEEAAARVLEGGEETSLEFEYPSPQGRRCYQMRLVPERDPQGRVAALLGVSRDVTAERRSLNELAESEARFRLAFEQAGWGMALLDPRGRLVRVNLAWRRLLGRGPAEAPGGDLLEMVHPEDLDRARRARDRVLASEGVESAELRLLPAGGGHLWVEMRLNAVRDRDGRVIYCAAALRDLTDARRAERERRMLQRQLLQAQKMEAIGTLAGGIAHDFNNILASIMGNAEMALEDAREGRATPQELEEIVTAAGRAKGLVHQILTFGRRVETAPQPLQLNRVVEQAAEMLRRTIPKMISLELELTEGLPLVEADPGQLGQVLINLGANAADAMPGGGRLTVATSAASLDAEAARQRDLEPGRYVVLSVADTGEGMDPETAEKIFDPFFTTKGVGKGTGLGLSTVYGTVTRLDGRIFCRSAPERGTTFEIFLPALKPVQKVETPPSQHPGEAPAGGGRRVLVVDDEEALLSMAGKMLGKGGYRVVTAMSGEEALEICADRAESLDLVLLDLGMPGMGGEACLAKLRARHPSLPVVVATGYADQGEELLAAGAAGFVGKPFRRLELLGEISRALDQPAPKA
jgi:PAS domain S-box-containing protein